MTDEVKALTNAMQVMIDKFWQIARDEDGEMPLDVASMIQASTDALAAVQAAPDEDPQFCGGCRFMERPDKSPMAWGQCTNTTFYGSIVNPDFDGCTRWERADAGEGGS